jgi:hypothetical protein
MTSSSSTWLTLKQAWDASPWTAGELRTLARKGIIQTHEVDDTLMFEPESFYMAMREELALHGGMSSRDAAIQFNVPHDALVEVIESEELYAYHTDIGWYLEPEEYERIPVLFPDALTPTPGQPSHHSQQELWESTQADVTPTQPSLPLSQARIKEPSEFVQHDLTLIEPSPSSPEPLPSVRQHECTSPGRWLTFKDAVRQSDFTHQELHHGIRTGCIVHKRSTQGRLMLEVQSFQDFHPDETWDTLEVYAADFSHKERRLMLRRLQSGQLHGRLMDGTWYVRSGRSFF